MHPSEVSEKAGATCPLCGMKMVPAAEHWLVGPSLASGDPTEPPLVIPHTAPLFTGKRVVVFVEKQSADDSATANKNGDRTYLVREVRLGARAGDVYIVQSGLMAGERVVRRGAFRLDSSMQIVGDASVMNYQSDDPAPPVEAGAPSGDAGSQP